MLTTTLTSKNQITIPAQLLREKNLKQGTRLRVRWDGDNLLLVPEKSLREAVESINTHLKPLIRKPQTDAELQENLRNWPKDMQ